MVYHPGLTDHDSDFGPARYVHNSVVEPFRSMATVEVSGPLLGPARDDSGAREMKCTARESELAWRERGVPSDEVEKMELLEEMLRCRAGGERCWDARELADALRRREGGRK